MTVAHPWLQGVRIRNPSSVLNPLASEWPAACWTSENPPLPPPWDNNRHKVTFSLAMPAGWNILEAVWLFWRTWERKFNYNMFICWKVKRGIYEWRNSICSSFLSVYSASSCYPSLFAFQVSFLCIIKQSLLVVKVTSWSLPTDPWLFTHRPAHQERERAYLSPHSASL